MTKILYRNKAGSILQEKTSLQPFIEWNSESETSSDLTEDMIKLLLIFEQLLNVFRCRIKKKDD